VTSGIVRGRQKGQTAPDDNQEGAAKMEIRHLTTIGVAILQSTPGADKPRYATLMNKKSLNHLSILRSINTSRLCDSI